MSINRSLTSQYEFTKYELIKSFIMICWLSETTHDQSGNKVCQFQYNICSDTIVYIDYSVISASSTSYVCT